MKQLYTLTFLLVFGFVVRAQDVYYEPIRAMIPGTYEFQLKDGSRLRGQLVMNDSASYLIRTGKAPDQRIAIGDILRADLVGGTFRHVPGHPNGFPFRLLFTQTAIPLERRRLYYQNCYLFISRLDVGLTRHWSVGGGFHTLRPGDFSTFSTKVSTQIAPKTRLAMSLQYVCLRVTESVMTRFGLLQGLVTVGEGHRNLTVGAGVTVSQAGLGTSGVLTIGYVRKVAPDLTFINQNMILIGERVDPRIVSMTGLLSAGLRFDRRRHAFDLAGMLPVYSHNRKLHTTLLPYGSYQVRIGK